MEKLLENKTAIVTGGTRGIGKAIATHYLKEGADVAIFGVNPERGAAVCDELAIYGKVKFYAVNVADHFQVEKTIDQVYEDFGKVDILVNNAGITRDNLLMKIKEEDWDAVLDTNLKSAYNTSHALIRRMMKARFGRIIHVTSVVGLIGNPGQTNYAASKAGMIGFSQSLAREVASRGITVNCIAPGFIRTDMTDALSDAQKEALLGQIPMKRLGEVEEVAQVALFLASSLANYVTGQTLTVDGGMVM